LPILTVSKLLHNSNTPDPNDVTLSGMVIEVNFLHSEKAQSPIVITPFGIVIDTKLIQPLNALESMRLRDEGKVMLVIAVFSIKAPAWIVETVLPSIVSGIIITES